MDKGKTRKIRSSQRSTTARGQGTQRPESTTVSKEQNQASAMGQHEPQPIGHSRPELSSVFPQSTGSNAKRPTLRRTTAYCPLSPSSYGRQQSTTNKDTISREEVKSSSSQDAESRQHAGPDDPLLDSNVGQDEQDKHSSNATRIDQDETISQRAQQLSPCRELPRPSSWQKLSAPDRIHAEYKDAETGEIILPASERRYQ